MQSPEIIITQPLQAASIYACIPAADIRQQMPKLLAELYAGVKQQGQAPAGSWFAHHHQPPAKFFDFDACVPVSQPIRADGRITPLEMPAVRVVRTVHFGSYEGLPGAWQALRRWIGENKLAVKKAFIERYLIDPGMEADPAKLQTELSVELLNQ